MCLLIFEYLHSNNIHRYFYQLKIRNKKLPARE
ncbi:hypothetical protein USA300HOU_2015 [Staphylococcus aureus subsp. aureus USA300_TCH1516]|nr:hypothetical protein USA300HOU_2015 [Staphylococcus aureus subsp. aureus USA300_TCH1516]EFU27119.1 hypothetical protein CGSSa01_13390 [Staphylococcus aureus subsp. aureus CGS01]